MVKVAAAAATAVPTPPPVLSTLRNSPPATNSPRRLPHSPARWVLLLLLIACGCGRPRSADDLYGQAETLRRRGFTKQAVEAADQGWRQWISKPGAEWHWKFRLLKAELLLNQRSAPQALELLEGAGVSPPSDELKARYLADLGQARRDPALIEQAFELASRQQYSALIPSIELKRAALDGYTNRAEAFLTNALTLARAQSDAYLEAAALNDLGFMRLGASRFDEAVPWLERAESVAHRAGADRLRERALGNLGFCYYRLGDFDRAVDSLSLAITLAREVADEDNLHRWLNDIGSVYYRRREFSQAIASYQASADLARRVNNQSAVIMALNNLAATSFENGDIDSAERFNSQAAALIGKANDSESRLHSQLHTAWIEAAKKQTAQAESSFRAVIDSATSGRDPLVLWEAETGLARLLHTACRDVEADTEYRKALATIEGEWSKLGEDRHKVTFLAQLITFYQDYVAFLAGRGEIERAAAVADSSRARVLAEKLGVEPGARKTATRAPKAGPILLSYWLAPAHSYLWLIGPNGISEFVLSGEARIAALVNQYNAAILRGHDPLARDNPAGRTLYQELLAPARSLIPAGASLIVIPDGCLHGLNFETLIVDVPTPHYWIEDVTLSVAPALGLLQPAPRRSATPGKLLLIGDPSAADPAFPPLPHLKREVEIVRQSFPSLTLLTGEQANPQAYRTAHPGDYSLIHFAAHAVANAESPLNSAVILSKTGDEYKLYAKDLLQQPLQADLVTISACHSAGARSYSGEGLLGFTWAVLQAGARNVVAGLWNADDAATAELMGEFYARLASGASPAAALRLAKLKLLKSAGQYRSPYYWGAFQLFTRSTEAAGVNDE
jgi:CHAT domain-containing protein